MSSNDLHGNSYINVDIQINFHQFGKNKRHMTYMYIFVSILTPQVWVPGLTASCPMDKYFGSPLERQIFRLSARKTVSWTPSSYSKSSQSFRSGYISPRWSFYLWAGRPYPRSRSSMQGTGLMLSVCSTHRWWRRSDRRLWCPPPAGSGPGRRR